VYARAHCKRFAVDATVARPSTSARPSVPPAWNPVKITSHSGRDTLCFKWWTIRPPVHMPLPAMTIAPPRIVLMAIDSWAERHNCRFGSTGMPRSAALCAAPASSSYSSGCRA